MTLEQLNIFVAVAEREHLTRAATALRLTPSAVSSAIKALENYYGVPLFNRVGRHIELTEAGRLFLAEAKATLARARSPSGGPLLSDWTSRITTLPISKARVTSLSLSYRRIGTPRGATM